MSKISVTAIDFVVAILLLLVSPIRRVVTLFEPGWLGERVFGARLSLLVRRSRAINATILQGRLHRDRWSSSSLTPK